MLVCDTFVTGPEVLTGSVRMFQDFFKYKKIWEAKYLLLNHIPTDIID